MSLSLPPCLPLSFLVLARWGEGPSTQRAGVGSLRQQGVKPRRARSQQPWPRAHSKIHIPSAHRNTQCSVSPRVTPEDFHGNTLRYKTKRTAQSLPEAHQDARHWLTQTCLMKTPQTNPHPDTEKTLKPQICTGTHRPSGTATEDTKRADSRHTGPLSTLQNHTQE